MTKFNSCNVLILGSGGREHAIAWKIKQSPILNKLYVAPGNSGTSTFAKNISVNIANYESVKKIILTENIGLLIIGPEDPLVNGLHDQLEQDAEIIDLIIIGPKKEGAMLEGSKSFAKKFMQKYNIPTASFKSFKAKDYQKAVDYLYQIKAPYVIKADGLAAGKGVVICNTMKEAESVIKEMTTEKRFGNAGNKIVIEEFLDGIELSMFILTDGENYKIFPAAKDYKRIGEGDTGLNTGGMGAISPVPFLDKVLRKKIENTIIIPTIRGLKKERIEYQGFIFFGLINVQNKPYVIEYNTRLGDPETQVIMPRIKSDLLKLLISIDNVSKFKKQDIIITKQIAATIILTSGGYPETYEKGHIIKGLQKVSESIVFHAGVKINESEHITNGGRVLAITSMDNSLDLAINKSYKNIRKIKFQDMYFRKDIGQDVL